MNKPKVAGDRSKWNWLLLIPVVVPVVTILFNADSPRVLGFPLFYWLQVVFVLVGVATTVTVYRLTEKRR